MGTTNAKHRELTLHAVCAVVPGPSRRQWRMAVTA